MRCEICKKYRKTAPHYTAITTPDGQEIQEYDFSYLCMECSNGSYWNLYSGYEKSGRSFVKVKK
jgi:hypothetical protein